ncbi:hypothetical protein PG993_006976 [Apiospora rasikravindrae]|uniref:Uncharacterized protein n=1 Tax=Apiospora rasikravindrae TaxID=990691 RepID=A0ABR1SW69_9PEZI
MAGSSRKAEEATGKPFSRPPKRFRLSDTTAAAGAAASCRKCDEVAQSVTQKMGEVMSQLSHLTETVQRLIERMDGLESSIAAKAQAADWKGEFVEKDDLVETVAAQVESEMDGVSDHLEEKLKEHLVEYVENEFEEKEAEILEAVVDKIRSARVRLDM